MFLSRWVKIVFFICIVFLNHTKGYAQYGNEDELKKQAAKYFEDEDYSNAYKAYSQLVSNYPKDPNYNYRLGVCMLFTESDKKKCFSYLEFANKNINDSEKEARFYLAKAYHVNFRFDEAIKLYTQYKEIGSGSMIKRLKVEREIQSCKNGKRLLSELNELVVLEKKQLAEGDYFRSYKLSDIGGKLLVKPEDFITSNDKKKKNKSIVYLPKSNDKLYYSSYGTGDNKDIFIVRRLPNGEWGKPENIGGPINTEFDEDYPFLHPNGKVLYFASQGHNSMGGYDIFKSELDEATGKWKTPVNMDFPINTPNDDILFVTDSLEKTAYFSSTRQSPNGKIDVYKINTERRPPEFIYIKGNVLKKSADQRVDSKITVKDINAGENIGSFQADFSGNYLIKIPNGGKFIFTVETIGFTTQSEGVDIPVNNSLLPYRQLASYDGQKLILQNLFETNKNDENAYLQYLEIIEQKSKMDVNASDFNNQALSSNNNTNNSTPNNNTSAVNNTNYIANNNNATTNNNNNPETNATNNTSNSNLSNTQLEKIAFDDANELKLEAIKLKSDANDAFTFVENQKFEASQKNKEALLAIENANNEQNSSKKEALQTKANELQEEAKKFEEQSKLAENIARNLESDANLKQKEADLQLKYAEQLKEVNTTKNNKEALTKLEAIQKELEALSKEKSNVNELSNSINSDITRKEGELAKLEPIVKKNQTEVSDLEAEIKNVDLEIDNTKDKELKNNLTAQREELVNELNNKKTELKSNKDKFDFVTNEKETLKSQADFANNMITQVKANDNVTAISNNSSINNNATNTNDNNNITNNSSSNNNPITENNTNNTGNNSTINNNGNETNSGVAANNNNNSINNDFESIKRQKEDKITELNTAPESSNRYAEQKKINTELLESISKEIEDKKSELKLAKKTEDKKNLTSKIKELETLKSEKESNNNIFDSKIAYHKNLENNTNANNNIATTNTSNTPTNSSINEELNNLIAQNNSPDNKDAFNINFNNSEAIKLKQKAEEDYTNAINKSKLTEEKINNLKDETQASNQEDFAAKSTKLNAEIDQLYKEAADLRKEANTLNGNAKTDKINQAKEKEALAANKKFELAQLTAKENEAKFELNQKIIDEYLAANGNKSNAEIAKASDLINESSTLYKQAIKIEEEANAEQDIAAKAASYSNVEEKEIEALAKQEEALKLLKKNNPNFSPKSSINPSSTLSDDVTAKLDDVKKEIAQKNTDINNSLLMLTEANQKEYSSLLANVTNNNVPEIANLKAEAEQLKNKAEQEKQDAVALQNPNEKNAKLIAANKSYKDAIGVLNNANKLSNSSANNNITNTNNSENNNINNGVVNNNNSENNNSNNNNGVVNNNNTENNNSNNNNGVVNNNTNNSENNKSNNNNGVVNNNTNNSENNNGVESNNANNSETNNGTNNTGNNNTNNNGIANNTNGNNTVNSNTVTPNSSKISAAETAKIKESEEYKTYTALNNDAKKYDEIALKETDKAKAYYNQATTYLKESNDLRIETDNMPNGDERTFKQEQAIKLDRLANEYKAKGDSVNELANNTRAFADSKKMESEAYASSIDKKTMDKILTVSGNTSNVNSDNNNLTSNNENNIATNNNTNTSSTNSNASNNNTNNDKYNGLSDGFKNKVSKLEADLKTFETAEPNQGNLEAQNQLLGKYNGAIDSEIKNEKKKLTTANPTQKATINNRIKTLEDQKTSNTKILNANKNKIASITAENNVVNNNNTNQNNSDNNTNVNNNYAVNNNTSNNTNNNNVNTANTNNTNGTAITGTGFKINNTNAYSASKPIPIDEKLPPGIIFAVQIGAFKNQIPNDLFKGLSPLRGETTSQGLIRYQAGRFLKFEEANGVKNDLKKLGYKDAFVVVYKDGQKLQLGEAFNILKGSGVNINVNPNETAGITINANVPTANVVNTTLANNNANTNNTINNQPIGNEIAPVVSKEISSIQGMLFTVQIGVYSNNVSSSQLFNLNPIYREQIPSGNFRYTAGIYSNLDKVKADRQKVNDLGIKDAFVSAYLNGQRIKIADALAKLGSGENVQFPADSPIQFNSASSSINTTPTVVTNTPTTTTNSNTNNNNTLQPFSNGVTQGPQPTPENGVKIGDAGVTFKVQIGAYKNQVPANVANNFLKIKEWPIQANQINGLYIYSVGSFVDAKSARPLLENAKQNGIADAYITVYRDGKKLYGAEASELLNK